MLRSVIAGALLAGLVLTGLAPASARHRSGGHSAHHRHGKKKKAHRPAARRAPARQSAARNSAGSPTGQTPQQQSVALNSDGHPIRQAAPAPVRPSAGPVRGQTAAPTQPVRTAGPGVAPAPVRLTQSGPDVRPQALSVSGRPPGSPTSLPAGVRYHPPGATTSLPAGVRFPPPATGISLSAGVRSQPPVSVAGGQPPRGLDAIRLRSTVASGGRPTPSGRAADAPRVQPGLRPGLSLGDRFTVAKLAQDGRAAAAANGASASRQRDPALAGLTPRGSPSGGRGGATPSGSPSRSAGGSGGSPGTVVPDETVDAAIAPADSPTLTGRTVHFTGTVLNTFGNVGGPTPQPNRVKLSFTDQKRDPSLDKNIEVTHAPAGGPTYRLKGSLTDAFGNVRDFTGYLVDQRNGFSWIFVDNETPDGELTFFGGYVSDLGLIMAEMISGSMGTGALTSEVGQ
jgi:hypothetical protein